MADRSQTAERPSTLDVCLRSSLSAHPERIARTALRCGLGDASVVCDALAETILEEHRGRGGKGAPTKLGRELAAIAKRCGDAVVTLSGITGS